MLLQRPQKPSGYQGLGAQDGHLDFHTQLLSSATSGAAGLHDPQKCTAEAARCVFIAMGAFLGGHTDGERSTLKL